MKKILILCTVAIFLLTTNFSGAISTNKQGMYDWDIIVDASGGGDYTSIQEAIDNAWPGARIFVKSGDYNEGQVRIEIPGLTIHGEDKFNTKIIGNKKTYCIYIGELASNTTISGFTITDGGCGGMNDGGGILVLSAYNTISENIITENIDGSGIRLDGTKGLCHHNNIIGNIITSPIDGPWAFYYGIALGCGEVNYNLISDNTISYYQTGILMGFSNLIGNKIIRNNITNNFEWGIHINPNYGNEIYYNNFIKNGGGLKQNARDWGSNTWDDGLGKGNYWDNYKGLDFNFDGIGDSPYRIPEKNKDRYPLMNPYPKVKSRIVNEPLINIFLMKILQRFPNAFPLLQKVLGI